MFKSIKKLSALLLGGALLAVGCATEGDIHKLNERIDALETGRVATLESQITILKETTLPALEKAMKDDLASAKGDLEKDIAALQQADRDFDTSLRNSVNDLTKQIGDNKKSAEDAIAQAKKEASDAFVLVNQAIDGLRNKDTEFASRIGTLEGKFGTTYDNLDAAVNAAIAAAEAKDATLKGNLEDQIKAAKKACEDYADQAEVDANAYTDAEVKKLSDKVAEDFAALEQAYKDADAALKTNLEGQIADAKTELQKAIDKVAADAAKLVSDEIARVEGLIAQAKSEFTTALGQLDTRLRSAEDAINTINEETIPAVKKQIEDLEALVAETYVTNTVFDAYKAATAETLRLMQASIDGLTALTAGFPEEKTIKQYIDDAIEAINEKLNDYVLKTTFEEFVRIAATKEELNAAKSEINSRIDGVEEAYKAADKALKEYVNGDEYLKNPEGAFQKVLKAAIKDAIDVLDAKYKDITDNLAQQISNLEAKDRELESAISSLNDVTDGIISRLEVAENLLAGDWDGKTVQGYINDADAQTLQDAMDYTDGVADDIWDEIDSIWETLDYYSNVLNVMASAITDLDDRLHTVEQNVAAIAKRLQSLTYVPDYDDLKMTMNVAYIVKDGMALPLPQKTEVTYKFMPQDVAGKIGDLYDYFVEQGDELTLEDGTTYNKFLHDEYGMDFGAYFLQYYFYFDVTGPLKTRSAEAAQAGKSLVITGIKSVDTAWGYITFEVLPSGIVSEGFTANELNPIDVAPWHYDWYSSSRYIWDYLSYDVYEADGTSPGYYPGGDSDSNIPYFLLPVYDADQLLNYRNRESYAVALEFQQQDVTDQPIYYYTIDWEECTIESTWDYESESYGYVDYSAGLWGYFFGDPDIGCSIDPYMDVDWMSGYPASNRVSSCYNVLMPSPMADANVITILEPPFIQDPEDPDADERGWVSVQDEYQTLEYNKPNTDEDGVKVILEEAQPLVQFDGKKYTYDEMWDICGVVVPKPVLDEEATGYTYSKGTATQDVNEDNFLEGSKEAETVPSLVEEYLTIAMSNTPEPTTLAQKKLAVGNKITGKYVWNYAIGDPFEWRGVVEIVKSKYETTATAHIDWTYALDANQDHMNFYNRRDEEGNIPIDGYSRESVDVTIPENVLSDLSDKYGIESLADLFAEWHLVGYTVKEGNDVTYTNGGEGEKAVFSNLAVDADGNITVSVTNFEFLPLDAQKKYVVSAVFENANVRFEIEFTLTTKDRDRTPITITLDEYDFILNGNDYDEATDTYTSEEQDFSDPLYKKFEDQKIINQGDPKDFDDAEDFIESGEGHLRINTEKDNSEFLSIGDDYAIAYMTSPELKANMGSNQEITVNTYIGQEVKIILPVGVELPGYDFLHGSYYTFNSEHANGSFIQKLDFEDNPTVDGEKLVKWWTRVNPSYLTGEENEHGEPESYRHALAKYDVSYINIAELAFNIVDKNDEILSDEDIENNKIVVDFAYTDETLGAKPLPEYSKVIDPALSIYSDLWMDQTTFYYRTNEKKFIPVIGKLAVMSGQTPFELPTRFDTPKAAVKVSGEVLDYSTYALVRWTPFIVPEKTADFDIVLDENKVYREPLFKTINLKDQRPNGVSYDVIKNGEWVIGNVEDWNVEAGTYTEGGNGYVIDIPANVAYDITAAFAYDDLALPAELRKLLSIMYYGPDPNAPVGPGPRPKPGDDHNPPTPPTPPQADPVFLTEAEFLALDAEAQKNYVPYIVYDYTSEITFHGKISIGVNVVLNTPWQEPINFIYNVNIMGYDYEEPAEEPAEPVAEP